MNYDRLLTFLKDPRFILALILVVFFLKGVFLSALQPLFVGQDETRHYNTIQYLAEPENAVTDAAKNPRYNTNTLRDDDNFDTYNYSEEIQKTAAAANTSNLRSNIYNTIIFSNSFDGANESAINAKIWKPYNYYTEPDTAGNTLYHKTASYIEKLLADQNILVRFYLIRIFSVLLATFAVFLAYLTARTIGYSAKVSLLLTAILTFHPKFSLYSTNINYDALLIPMFFLFTYAGVRALKYRWEWQSLTLLVGSIVVAVLTKGTGYILVAVFLALITHLLYEKLHLRTKRLKYSVYSVCFFVSLSVVFYLYSHLLGNDQPLTQTMPSLATYISKTITVNNFILPSATYWGTLSWSNSWIISKAMSPIFIIETIAFIGLGLLLFSKKLALHYPDFLPAKKYIIFLIGMIVALQLGIRAADWSSFSNVGSMQASIGTPGRYFIPNLCAHILLTFAGLGALLHRIFSAQGGSAVSRKYFETMLSAGLILMFSLTTYLIFDVIILRFYF